jgi:hypothetical protein
MSFSRHSDQPSDVEKPTGLLRVSPFAWIVSRTFALRPTAYLCLLLWPLSITPVERWKVSFPGIITESQEDKALKTSSARSYIHYY